NNPSILPLFDKTSQNSQNPFVYNGREHKTQKEIALAEAILALVGGKENILTLSHWINRVQINAKDAAKLELDKSKALSGVMGVVNQSGESQITLGTGVAGFILTYFLALRRNWSITSPNAYRGTARKLLCNRWFYLCRRFLLAVLFI
ncbi:MAG: hypothetical protein WBZ33_06920, partial [Thermoactinomyces sp.]